jgi:hypothetical protein
MSFRTIAVRIRQHDWLAVVIELTVVVAGVFIALQVSNWNDDRKEAARGREYLQRLHDDMAQDVANLDTISGFWTRVRDYGDGAVGYAEQGVLVNGSAWRTLLAYYQASQLWPYRKPDVTFQEIQSSGDLRLIRNAALRARIARHYSATAGSQVVEVLGLVPRYRERVRGMTPWKIQQYIWSNCYRSADADQELLDCAAPVSETESLAVIERYRQSSQLTDELRFWMVNLNSGLQLMQGIQADALALSDDVERELGP